MLVRHFHGGRNQPGPLVRCRLSSPPRFLFWYFRTTILPEGPTFERVRFHYRFSGCGGITLFSDRPE